MRNSRCCLEMPNIFFKIAWNVLKIKQIEIHFLWIFYSIHFVNKFTMFSKIISSAIFIIKGSLQSFKVILLSSGQLVNLVCPLLVCPKERLTSGRSTSWLFGVVVSWICLKFTFKGLVDSILGRNMILVYLNSNTNNNKHVTD